MLEGVTSWKLAMLLTGPLMVTRPKLRTWAAMMLASIAAWLVPYGDAAAYLAIDLLAGGLVLVRPAGVPQRIVGALFAGMAMFDIGFLLSGETVGTAAYMAANIWAGWLQWAVLFIWGGHDAARYIADRYWPSRHPVPVAGRDG